MRPHWHDNVGMVSRRLEHQVPDAAQVAALGTERLAQMLHAPAVMIEELKRQLEWFKRQLFGRKSERFAPQPEPQQMHLEQLLGEELAVPEAPRGGEQMVPAHKRRQPRSDFTDDANAASFFDESKVPVQSIELPAPEIKDLAADQYEVIGSKTSWRLAQRPGAYVVLKYVRPVIKRLQTQTLHCAPAPAGVIEGSAASPSAHSRTARPIAQPPRSGHGRARITSRWRQHDQSR